MSLSTHCPFNAVSLLVKQFINEGARDFFVRYFGAKPNAGYHNVQTGFRSFFLSFDDNVRLEVMTKP